MSNINIEHALSLLHTASTRYTRTERYYRGEHDLSFATEKFQNAFGSLFREREARFLIENEWALTAADILDRRTKHGLHMTPAERQAFTHWLDRQQAAA